MTPPHAPFVPPRLSPEAAAALDEQALTPADVRPLPRAIEDTEPRRRMSRGRFDTFVGWAERRRAGLLVTALAVGTAGFLGSCMGGGGGTVAGGGSPLGPIATGAARAWLADLPMPYPVIGVDAKDGCAKAPITGEVIGTSSTPAGIGSATKSVEVWRVLASTPTGLRAIEVTLVVDRSGAETVVAIQGCPSLATNSYGTKVDDSPDALLPLGVAASNKDATPATMSLLEAWGKAYWAGDATALGVASGRAETDRVWDGLRLAGTPTVEVLAIAVDGDLHVVQLTGPDGAQVLVNVMVSGASTAAPKVAGYGPVGLVPVVGQGSRPLTGGAKVPATTTTTAGEGVRAAVAAATSTTAAQTTTTPIPTTTPTTAAPTTSIPAAPVEPTVAP